VILLDAGIDFVQPEFLNILFFKQKNLVIFPYVDLKHLHALELFTVGYNVVDLESTALYNIKEIIEFEANNSYSQNRTFFFIYNLDRNKIKDIMEIADIRCVLNTNEDVRSVKNGNNFIFYNKKNKTFLDYDKSSVDLEFERYLISTSENETVLYEKIQQIKIVATKIFMEINQNSNFINKISEILEDFDFKFWNKILKFVKIYFKIEVPEINSKNLYSLTEKSYSTEKIEVINKKILKEYEFIITLNKHISKEFVQLLHEYRSQKVNPSHLDLEQLYNPQKLYIYLRTHHWANELPKEFIEKWIQMRNTEYELSKNDILDFKKIFKMMGSIDKPIHIKSEFINRELSEEKNVKNVNNMDFQNNKKSYPFEIPSIIHFYKFKDYLEKKLDDIENFIDQIKES
jgi:hypothetical protein